MSEETKNTNQEHIKTAIPLGGGSGPVSGVSGMSPTERVHYIQEIQRSSPVSALGDAIKKISLDGFGLADKFFTVPRAVLRGVSNTYEQMRADKKSDLAINQHISGVTEEVRGIERLRHTGPDSVSVDFPDPKKSDTDRSFFIDSSWTPKKKGSVE